MTRDEIIRMAREAGFESNSLGVTYTSGWLPDLLERFAALVEKHLIASGYRKCAVGQRTTQFCGQLEQAVLAEREACAKVCDERERANLYGHRECAAAIRAREPK
jgi:hypothetical protein